MKTMKTKMGRMAVLAAALLLAAAATAALAGAGRALAGDSANLEVGGSIYYAGYNTNWFTADGQMAYCGNPSMGTPASGPYEKEPLAAMSGRTAETAADLWFGYGGPGFDASMWPSTWYDGSEMSDARYAALTHILLSDTFSSDGNYALHGCSQEFADWARWNVIGFDENGNEVNTNATGRQACYRQGEVGRTFQAYMLQTGEGTQVILSFDYTPTGSIELVKKSANTAVTDGNACYGLGGAHYGIYSDESCTAEVAELVTDDGGHAKTDGIETGNYWVKEKTPSTGMQRDETPYPVTVQPSATVEVNGGTVYETPQSDPVGMLLGKVDATTNKNKPESAASLKGAIYTVEYYDGYYGTAAEAKASGDATRTWEFATDKDGFAYYSQEFKHSGPDLYYQTGGKTATLPLGTVLVTETAAPEGYNLDDGAHNKPETLCIQITNGGQVGEFVYTYNSPKVPDTVKRGDYRIEKEVPTTNDDENQALTRIAVQGVQFQIINDNTGNVVSPDTLEEVAPGSVVTTLTTDENGFATTKSHVPAGWTAALAYGEYTVHEIIPDNVAARVLKERGVTLIGVEDWKITVSDELQYDPVQIVANHIPQTPITIQKKDATTGKVIPLACSFQIYDATGRLVTYTDHYADKVVDTWTTFASGKCTLPMKLDEGSYTLVEVQSPEGYVLGAEPVAFTVDEYRTWDNPITVTYEDSPIMGRIEIDKTSSTTAAEVGGAQYRVIAAADIVTGDGTVRAKKGDVMDDVVTDADGHAEVDELFLGSYTVYETKSAPGYALDTAEHPVELVSQGQTVPVVSFAEDVTDKPTTIKILKVDETDATKALPGATFRIWQDVEGGYDEELVTGADGTIDATLLPHGTFHIEEVEAPQGYYLSEDAETVDFKVDDQGFIGLAVEGSQFSDTLALTFDNAPTKVDITKADLTSGAELPGAKLAVTDSNGKAVDEWTSTNEAHRITGIAPGDYTLTETIAPEGYLKTTSVAFTVKGTGEVQKVAMKDDYTKTDFAKTDATTGDEVAGAHLQVVDSNGKTVAEWDTDGKVHRANGLVPGDYRLVETTAPEGYEVSEEVMFTVKDTGEIQKVEMKDARTPDTPGTPDTPKGEMPKTGDSFPWWIAALLAGAAGCGIGAIALVRRHDDGKDDSTDDGEPEDRRE